MCEWITAVNNIKSIQESNLPLATIKGCISSSHTRRSTDSLSAYMIWWFNQCDVTWVWQRELGLLSWYSLSWIFLGKLWLNWGWEEELLLCITFVTHPNLPILGSKCQKPQTRTNKRALHRTERHNRQTSQTSMAHFKWDKIRFPEKLKVSAVVQCFEDHVSDKGVSFSGFELVSLYHIDYKIITTLHFSKGMYSSWAL